MEVEWERKKTMKENVPEIEKKARELVLPKEEVAKLTEFQIKQIGTVDQETLEAMLVGYLIDDPSVKNKQLTGTRNAEDISASGIKGKQFENSVLGIIFDDLLSYYRATRRLLTRDEAKEDLTGRGYSQDQAFMFETIIAKCRAAVISRRIYADILIKKMKRFVLVKESDRIIKKFISERNNPDVGIEKAIDSFKKETIKSLRVDADSIIRECDWIHDFKADLTWLIDMKKNPDKYRGCYCGIKIIDEKTDGFKPGQLTVLVGKHGGYKTTLMMNIGYGLWENAKNILYVSLEMESKWIKSKLWCRATKKIPWSRISKGIITTPEDWTTYEYLSQKLNDDKISPEEKFKIQEKVNLLQFGLYGDPVYKVEKGKEDIVYLEKFYELAASRPNKFKIINVGQSQKITVSQLEKYIEENMENFQPDVVIVDYLALVASDVAYPDRRDIEVGDVCKYFRKMGERLNFGVVTAAQYKRAAIERIRKYGFTNPEKASLGTDDIAESNQIGADADCVFMLWPEDGGNRIRVFSPKVRWGTVDVDKGVTIGVRPEICMVADDIGDTVAVSDDITLFEGIQSAQRLAEGKKLSADLPDEGWTDESVIGISGADDFFSDEDDLGI